LIDDNVDEEYRGMFFSFSH